MGKTILITGASTGIGAQTALTLAKDNLLFVHYNASAEAAMQVVAQVEQLGGRAVPVQADVTTEKGCEALVAAVAAQTDHLDVLINNAGGLVQRQAADALQWELMERVFALNTFSTMKITSLCIPLLRKSTQDPNIVNVSSVVIRHGGAGATIYAAAKGGVDVFTRGMAKELARHPLQRGVPGRDRHPLPPQGIHAPADGSLGGAQPPEEERPAGAHRRYDCAAEPQQLYKRGNDRCKRRPDNPLNGGIACNWKSGIRRIRAMRSTI